MASMGRSFGDRQMMPLKTRHRWTSGSTGHIGRGRSLGSFASLIFLNAFAANVGWRLACLIGPVLALVVIVVGAYPAGEPAVAARPRPRRRGRGRTGEDRGSPGRVTARAVSDDLAIELVPETQYGHLRFLRFVFHTYPKRRSSARR